MTKPEINAAAAALLLRQPLAGAYALHFLDYRHLVLDGGILIASFSDYENKIGKPLPDRLPDGAAVRFQNKILLFYNDAVSPPSRIAFTIAHELGHVLLGHAGPTPAEERQANRFAAALLMPEAVIRFLDCQAGRPLSPEDMTTYFAASLPACRRRRREILPDAPFVPSPEEIRLVRCLFSHESDL